MQLSVIVKRILSKGLVEGRNYTKRKEVYARVKENTSSVILTRKQKKEIKDFYSKYGKVSLKFHNFYLEKTGRFAVNYLPEDVYFTKIGRFYNDYLMSRALNNKCDYPRFFAGIPQPEMIAYKRGGYWFLGDELITEEKLLEIMKREGKGFIKIAIATGGAAGVTYVDNSTDDNYEKTILKVIGNIKKDIVIQRPLIQHKSLSNLNESSVNTMRILTLLRNGEVKIYSSLLRIGKADAKVDNGSISVGIKPDGKLKEYGYYLTGERVTSHPESGVILKDYQLPSYEEARELVKKAHLRIPQFKLASWDIAIREDGTPTMIEVNTSDGEVSFHQLNNGPLFGDDTREILDEVFHK